MDDQIQTLLDQGYRLDEAELVLHVCKVQREERAEALRTGMCKCGSKLRRMQHTLECGNCSTCHAA